MDKIKINLNVSLLSLDGKPLKETNNGVEKPVTAGKTLAQSLVSQTKGDALKYFAWAIDLYADKTIELDESDYDKLLSFVKDNESLTVLSKAQLIQFLKGAKEEFDFQKKEKKKA